MPRNVRNFWIELQVDGRKETIATGPRSADGGFYLRVHVRSNGAVKPNVISMVGRVTDEGKIRLSIDTPAGFSMTENER
jgi:hypothetical protein